MAVTAGKILLPEVGSSTHYHAHLCQPALGAHHGKDEARSACTSSTAPMAAAGAEASGRRLARIRPDARRASPATRCRSFHKYLISLYKFTALRYRFHGLTGPVALTMLRATLKRTAVDRLAGRGGCDGQGRSGQTRPAKPARTASGRWQRRRPGAPPASTSKHLLRRDGRKGATGRTIRSLQAMTGVGQALKLSSEFIAGIAVGVGIGWVIDRWAGTSPWGLIVFLLLGFGAAVLNVLRSAGMVAEARVEAAAARMAAAG